MTAFELIDQLRRCQGAAFDGLVLGPWNRPRRTAHAGQAWILTAYQEAGRATASCLLVPAPIKRAYIFDLVPGASVVEKCVSAGFATYLIDWQPPGGTERDNGLAEYADRWLLSALDAVAGETGQSRVFLIGHSLGGTLAALFSALHPARVAGLVLLEAPVHFGPEGGGALHQLVATIPRMGDRPVAGATIPGSFLDLAAWLAAPGAFGRARWVDWLVSLAAGPAAVRLHLAVERWALDELAMPRSLFEQVINDLYRDDAFMRGTLTVGGRRALPREVRGPILSVVNPRSRIVPPASVLPFHAAVATGETRVLTYQGDIGVALQHVGVLVGGTAHRRLWPEILGWIDEHSLAMRDPAP